MASPPTPPQQPLAIAGSAADASVDPAHNLPKPPPGSRAAGGAPRAWMVLLTAALLSLVVDLGSKWLAFRSVAPVPVSIAREDVLAVSRENPRAVGMLIPPHDPVVVVPHILEFTLVLNPGAVFGMGPGQRWFFIAFTGVALAFGLWMFARWTRPQDHGAHIAIGMLLGGGLGNLYDRLTIGVVRDFLHPLPGVKWPFGLSMPWSGREVWPYVSNIADLLLLIGIGILLAYLWRREQAEIRHRRQTPSTT